MPTKMSGMEFWRQDCLKLRFFILTFLRMIILVDDALVVRSMGSPVNVVAPMVDASELAWRMLGRRFFFCRQNISNIFFFKNCFFLWSFRIFFSAQTRSTPSFHADVACRMFHTGCKIQVSSKSPSPLSSERALIIFMLIIRFRANTSIFTWMVKAIGIQSQQQ